MTAPPYQRFALTMVEPLNATILKGAIQTAENRSPVTNWISLCVGMVASQGEPIGNRILATIQTMAAL